MTLSFLDGMKVLEIGGRARGAGWAGSTLRELGAEVSTVDFNVGGHEELSWFDEYLRLGKAVISGKSVDAVLSEYSNFDVVLFDRIECVAPGASEDSELYRSQVESWNRHVWVSISAYGISGPRANLFGSDLSILASSGTLESLWSPSRGPITLPGKQGLLAAGQAAALAALHGLDIHANESRPVHMDVSAQESMIATGTALPCGKESLPIPAGEVASRIAGPFGVYPCVDGLLHVGAMETHQWLGVGRILCSEKLSSYLETREGRDEHTGEIVEAISSWTSIRTKMECEISLQREGVPASAVNSFREAMSTSQLLHRRQTSSVAVGKEKVDIVKSPYFSLTSQNIVHSENNPARVVSGLLGLRILECSHVIAAPAAGSLLGAMGARVVKIEDPTRLDSFRRTGPFIDGVNDPEWSGYFALVNHSKHSFLNQDVKDLQGLIRNADVVLQNWGTRRASRARIDASSVGLDWPDKLAISCSGLGQGGPSSEYSMYAYSVNAQCGLTNLISSGTEDIARLNRFAWADFCTAYAMATVIAAWAVGHHFQLRSGSSGAQLDMSMVEIMIHRLMPVVTEESTVIEQLDIRNLQPCMNKPDQEVDYSVTFGPNIEDTVVFSARASEILALAELVDANESGEEQVLFDSLRVAGINYSRIVTPRQLIADPQLVARGFFSSVEHPRWGTRQIVGVPWQCVEDGNGIRLSSAPLLGDCGDDIQWDESLMDAQDTL